MYPHETARLERLLTEIGLAHHLHDSERRQNAAAGFNPYSYNDPRHEPMAREIERIQRVRAARAQRPQAQDTVPPDGEGETTVAERPEDEMITQQRYENIVIERHRGGQYQWFAHFDSYDGPGSPIGHGSTPGEAVDDLFDVAEIIP